MQESVQPKKSQSLTTREVRWFRRGSLPQTVSEWFGDSAGPINREVRTDSYDLREARRGVGLKIRADLVEEKRLISRRENVQLADGLLGHVEDWRKESRPIEQGNAGFGGEQVEIAKDILTRRFVPDPADATGCEVEISRIRANEIEAWSLCFETFGRPEMRGRALGFGIAQMLIESPMPNGQEMEAANSCGYPVWLAGMPVGRD